MRREVRPRARRHQGQMPPRVRLGRTHGRSNTPRHEIQAGADLSPRQPALRRSHKFTAPTEFCKRLPCIKEQQKTLADLRQGLLTWGGDPPSSGKEEGSGDPREPTMCPEGSYAAGINWWGA